MSSSYAASVSSHSSASRRARVNKDAEEEEGLGDAVQRTRSLENGIFGVLFTLSKENSETRVRVRWVLLKVLLDAWQLFTTIIDPEAQGWRINANGTAWKIVSVLNFGWLSDLGYGAYLGVLYAMVILLVINVAMCVWVAWCFKERKFPVVWPVKVLRVFSSVFFQAFDVTSLNLLQLGITCRYTGPTKLKMHLELFPQYGCASTPHLAHAIVSALSLGLFVAIALLLNMAEVEVNPKSRRPLALGHSGPEVMAFAMKVLLTLVDVFLGWRTVAACCYLALTVALAYQYIRWNPNLVTWMNYLKSGASIVHVWISAMLVLLVFHPSIKADQMDKFRSTITTVMLAGLAPAFGAGALMSWGMIRYLSSTALRALAKAKPDTPLEDVCTTVDDPKDVEVVSRCLRVWQDNNTLDPEAVSRAHGVIKAGLAMFPSRAFMVLLHANFMIDVLGVTQSGNSRVEDARKLNPGLMCRFMMFVRRQQATQRAVGKSATDRDNMDLLGYVEYQRKQRMVVRLHREALQAMCNFWKALDASNISFTHLSKALGKIENSVSQAQAAYRIVLESYGNNPKLVRLYGRFLQTIKNDPWGASEYLAEAERLEEVKNSDSSGPLLPDGTPLGRMDEMMTSVVVMNMAAEIQVANRQTHTLFGAKRGNLEGKPVTALLAPHCGRWVLSQLKELVVEASVVAAAAPDGGGGSHEAVLVGMHTDRLAFPLKVSISRVSGVGEDSTFIALLEPLEPERDVASIWISHNGTIAACDPNFGSFFGWKPYEVIGASITAFMSVDISEGSGSGAGTDVEAGRTTKRQYRGSPSDTIARLVAKARVDDSVNDGKTGHGVPCIVAHKYESTPLSCVLSVRQADAADVTVYEARIRLTSSSPQELLVVNRKGAIIHTSSPLAARLKDSAAAGVREGPAFGGVLNQSSHGGGVGDPSGQGASHGHAFTTDLLSSYTLTDFLPPPWRHMHVKFLKDVTAMTAPSRGQWSCRRGGSGPGPTLELRSAGGKPLYMRVSVATTDMAGELTHVMRMASSSLENALGERRLRLSLSEEGLITGIVSGAPSQLFGLNEAKIAGRGLWEVVEELDTVADCPSAPGPLAFKALMNRSLEAPGHSWRVRVAPPQRAANPGPASELITAARPSAAKVAVLQMCLEEQDAAPDAAANLFVDIWPVANVTGVLELDASGRVTSILEEALRPAGLLFGLPGQTLLGTSFEELVALPPGRVSASDLLSLHGAKKSSLKVKKKEAHVKVGPVHVLKGLHSDGLPLSLEVQVIGKPGPNQPVTAVLRVHKVPMLTAATAVSGSAPPRLTHSQSWAQKAEPAAAQKGEVSAVAALPAPSPAAPLPHAPQVTVRKSSKESEDDGILSPTRVRLSPQSQALLDTGATTGCTMSPRHTGYSNAQVNCGEVQVTPAAGVSVRDLVSGRLLDALPLPGVASGKAAALAGRSKLAGLVKSVDDRRASISPTSKTELLGRTGTGALTASRRDFAMSSSQHLGEPSLPGSASRTDQCLDDVPKKVLNAMTSAGGRPGSDSDSDASAERAVKERIGPVRKMTRLSEATERVANWVTSEGSFYQNSVRPTAGGKGDDDDGDISRQSDDLEIVIKHRRPGSGALRAQSSGISAHQPGPAIKGAPYDPSSAKPAPYADDDAASEGGQSAISGASGLSDQEGGGGAEYRRGKRFRKLAKMMDSSQAQQVSQRFRAHSMGVVAILAIVHVICFCVTINAIQSQKRSMMQLGKSGDSQRFMHRVLADVRSLDMISRNKTSHRLFTADNTTFFLNRISSDVEIIKERLNGMLEAHHASSSSVMNVFYYTTWRAWKANDEHGSDIWTNLTVWDFGTQFYNYAKDVIESYQRWADEDHIPVGETSAGQFLLKSGPDLWRASRKALDALLYVAVGDTHWVDNLQLIFLAVEGAFLSSLAAFYVAYLLRAVAAQRFKLYSTFLIVPVGLTRALASQNTALLVDEDDDDADFDDDKAVIDEQEEEQEDEGTATKAKRRAKLNIADGVPPDAESPGPSRVLKRLPSRNSNQVLASAFLSGKGGQSMRASDGKGDRPRGPFGFLRALTNRLKHGLNRRGRGANSLPLSAAGPSAATSKRSLRYDSHETVLMVMPFVLWSALVIGIYAAAVVKMKDVAEVVAVHSVANFMAARTYRTVFFTQELANVEDPALLPSHRAALSTCKKIVTDAYYTLQLGENAYKSVGPATERFPLVQRGMAFDTPELASVFYNSGRCHRLQEHLPCPEPGYRFYQTAYTGVDSIMREFLQRVSDLAESESTTPPGLENENVDWIYNVGSVDLSDGTVQIEQLHYQSITALFTRITLLHVVLLLSMWIVIAGFLFILLNPVLKRVSRERRHIAELMSQLPLELDVEKLVARALGTLTAPGTGLANGATQEHTLGDNADGHESDGGAEATNKWKAIIRSTSNSVAKQASGNFGNVRRSSTTLSLAGFPAPTS